MPEPATRRLSLASTIAIAVAQLAAAPVFAQAATTGPIDPPTDAIIVTGSCIKSPQRQFDQRDYLVRRNLSRESSYKIFGERLT